jgi:hypothetical protein
VVSHEINIGRRLLFQIDKVYNHQKERDADEIKKGSDRAADSLALLGAFL